MALTSSVIQDHDPVMNVAPTIVSSKTPIPNVIFMLLKNFSRWCLTGSFLVYVARGFCALGSAEAGVAHEGVGAHPVLSTSSVEGAGAAWNTGAGAATGIGAGAGIDAEIGATTCAGLDVLSVNGDGTAAGYCVTV